MNQIAKMKILDIIDEDNLELEEIHICIDAD